MAAQRVLSGDGLVTPRARDSPRAYPQSAVFAATGTSRGGGENASRVLDAAHQVAEVLIGLAHLCAGCRPILPHTPKS
jgi:hypothetical protein